MKNRKVVNVVFFVIIALLILGIGYAGISAVDLIVNGYGIVRAVQTNFVVHFIRTSTLPMITEGTGTASIDESDDTIAHFDITGLSKKGDKATAVYRVRNDSKEIGADVSLDIENSNVEYFKTSVEIQDSQLMSGDETNAILTVELLKSPINEDVSTNITARLVANPIDNSTASGNDNAVNTVEEPSMFSTDSWTTIKNSVHNGYEDSYHVGDIKEVMIDNKKYKLRVVNVSNDDNCIDSGYSETACGFVVEFMDPIICMKMKNNNSSGGYTTSDIATYLNGEFFNKLPVELRNSIVDTRVVSGHENNVNDNYIQYNQKLYLLSATELFGRDKYNYDSSKNCTHQLDFYKNAASSPYTYEQCNSCGSCSIYTIQILDGTQKKQNNSNVSYWIRDAVKWNSNYTYVNVYGQANECSYNNYNYVFPAFRIK